MLRLELDVIRIRGRLSARSPRRRARSYCRGIAHVELSEVVKAIRSSSAPPGMMSRIIAVDGPGGAGKTSLAEYLARELDAPIVHTDDFASWENPVDWWPEVIEKVLAPLAAGQCARYTPTTWGGPEKEEVVIEPADFVLLEGVTAARTAFRSYLA